MKKINTDILYLIFLTIILILAAIPTYAHHGMLLMDCGREVYYPVEILSGKILYKDIFNIYGPFAYMFNAGLYKIFGVNLNALYLSGCVCALLITTLIYSISRNFLPKLLSFSIAVFTIVVGVLNTNLFNFIFPYSYAMLYGTVTFLISFMFLIKYCNNSENSRLFYLSCFFAGISVANKYEFLSYSLVLLFSAFWIKRLKVKEYLLAIGSFVFIPVFVFLILFVKGLSISNLGSILSIINKMSHSQSLKYFYLKEGVFFNPKYFELAFRYFIQNLIPFGLLILAAKCKQKYLFMFLVITSAVFISFWTNYSMFIFLPLLILLLGIINIKNNININNKTLFLLFITSIFISLKTFWGFCIISYAVFSISFLLITFFALFFENFKGIVNKNLFCIYILIVSIALGHGYINSSLSKNSPIKTGNGVIYAYKYLADPTNMLIDYINKNTKKTDKIVILPEGTFINFLTDRKSDDYYNSLIPLYFEVFGEDKFIEHFKKTKPDYIIFNSLDMSQDYYFKNICNDYAFEFCSFVAKNYMYRKEIDVGFRYLIYSKK